MRFEPCNARNADCIFQIAVFLAALDTVSCLHGVYDSMTYAWIDNCYNGCSHHHSPSSLVTGRLHMDRIRIPSSCRIIDANMGQIQRYMGPETHHIGRQCFVLCWISHSGFEYQYSNAARRKSCTRHRWWRLDNPGQHLHQ